jgi:uncharacterized protein (DUF1800 family)
MTDHATLAAIRFCHGLPLPEGSPTDAAGMMRHLAGPDDAAATWPGLTLAKALPLHLEAIQARQARQGMTTETLAYKAKLKAVAQQSLDVTRVTFARALGATDGFRERLVRFWADHFTTVAKRPTDRGLMLAMIDDAIRPNITRPFSGLLKAATLHPAMLTYLDQNLSVGPNSPRAKGGRRGLNENLARELIELHTLGVDAGYSQADVRQMAELLTGLKFTAGEGQGFNPKAAEPGPETVLGRVYDGEGTAPILKALEDLALRPETGRHLARKLAVHFISDMPDPGLITQMEVAYSRSGGDLLALYAAMLGHDAAWTPDLTKARQPYDFMVAALRALDVGPERVAAMSPINLQKWIVAPMRAMGQPMQQAPGPDGWPEEAAAWITPQRLAARITWGMEVPPRILHRLPDPAALANRALGPRVSETLRFAVSGAENIREGVGLVLASAEFNRR